MHENKNLVKLDRERSNCYKLRIQCTCTFKIDNGSPGLIVFGDFPEDPEGGYLTLYIVGLQ